MKPIYIEMKAFGSYRDEKIDFTGKSQGLFLIMIRISIILQQQKRSTRL